MIPPVKNEKMDFIQSPIINGLQKMAVYRTRSMFYIIGTNILQTKFRVLKVDRTVPYDLVLTDDKVEYTPTEIRKMISMLNDGNKLGPSSKGTTGATRNVSAFGILGFIRFLEGYYMILITKREKVAVIGHHSIYKIADTSIICIPHESVRIPHEDEYKYVKSFNSIDLTSHFYFSYTYDLSNSLQYNMAPFPNIDQYVRNDTDETFMNPNLKSENSQPENSDELHVACKATPNWKFIWNHFLLQELISQVHDTWILPVTHGFINQITFNTSGKIINLALVARRSAKYAGTRFLKRGANSEGDVANEVESEQIVYDTNVLCLHKGNFTSFVQIRGSIPTHWSHLGNRPKPPIIIDLSDTYATTAGKHFNKLLTRFGSPVIVLNLVKQQQLLGKKTKECILNDEYVRIIDQLNITIPKVHHLQLISLDMAHIKRAKNEDVMEHLRKAAEQAVKRTGIFQSSPIPYSLHLDPNSDYQEMERTRFDGDQNFGIETSCETPRRGRNQTGVLRVNCVDCLDRTNTAMYAVSKCALGFQLYVLAALENPFVENGSECAKMLQTLFDDHGNTLAHQYAGSNLVHRIDSYQQTSGWTDQGRDLMESGRRYYKNTVEDQEKQKAINLFLGVVRPSRLEILEAKMTADIPNLITMSVDEIRKNSALWLNLKVQERLPFASEQLCKVPSFAFLVKAKHSMINMFNDSYRYNEFFTFSKSFQFNMDNYARNFASTDQSVFSAPTNQRRHYEDAILFSKNSETASLEGNTSLSLTKCDAQSNDHLATSTKDFEKKILKEDLKFEAFFEPLDPVYAKIFGELPEDSTEQFKKYLKITEQPSVDSDHFNMDNDCSQNYQKYEQVIPEVSEKSIEIYKDYVAMNFQNLHPNQQDLSLHHKLSLK